MWDLFYTAVYTVMQNFRSYFLIWIWLAKYTGFSERSLKLPQITTNCLRTNHYSHFEVRLFIIRQNMNFGFWKFFLVEIIVDYVYFHMTYHTFIWNHACWHRSVLNMTYFQLFAWFGQTLLVRKMGKKSKLLIVDTFGSKTNLQWSGWFWTICWYQIFKCN